MRVAWIASVVMTAAGAWTGPAHAQTTPEVVKVSVRQLVPGHYVVEAGRFNGGAIATSEGVVVIDALAPGLGPLIAASDAVSRQQRAQIESQLKLPVRYLVSSTFHDNYSKGNVSFSDVTRIGTERYRTDLLALMERGKISADEQRARMPTQTFHEKMTLRIGGKEIQILHFGRGHTAGDSIVYVPQDRVAYLSELYFHEEFPNMAEGYGIGWIEVLEKVQALDADIFVPGHGIMPADPRDTREGLRRALQRLVATRDAVQREIARGASESEAVEAIQFPEYKDLRGYPEQKDVAVRRIYRELKGQLP